jgi:CubicO group peptidase (beta-lactamase class C family)
MPKSAPLLLLLAAGCAGEARQSDPEGATRPLADTLAALASRFAAEHRLPGLAVGVWRDGTVLFRGGFGRTGARADEAEQTVGPTTVFHLASVTKPFVATAVMQLVDAGLVSLDSTVVQYLPYFSIKGPGAATITVRQVLSHMAGIGDVTDYQWDRPEYDDRALERYVRGLADSTLIARPGERWAYSNIGFEILADLIAKVSGESFEGYLQRRILAPLGMGKSTLLMTDIDSSLMAHGHSPDSTGSYRRNRDYPYNRRHAASSTLHSNVNDMLRWGAANLGRGELTGRRILDSSSYDELWKVQHDMTAELGARAQRAGVGLPFERIAIGLGWFLPTHQGRQLVWHSGGDLGFRTDLVLSPSESVAVVVLANGDGAAVTTLSVALLEAVRRAGAMPVTPAVPATPP